MLHPTRPLSAPSLHVPHPHRDRRRLFRLGRLSGAFVLACGLLLAGCGKQSIVSPRSPQTHDIRTLWWWMLAVATVVFLGAVAMLVLAWFKRGTPGLPYFGEREVVPQTLVVIFGIGIPLVVLISLFGVADVWMVQRTAAPKPAQTSLTVNVIGHQWWWEIRYPGTDAVTANEIHIPVNTRVNVVATTADVIHSFWVPQLARKIDEVPGRNNRVLLYASRPGRYRGQCAEFCGFQHANMSLFVIAEPRAAFQSWLTNMEGKAAPPTGGTARAGERLFMANQCASCHQIRGTSAQGLIGPDLTHVASRRTLAAATIRNTPGQLRAWIAEPQRIKPGSRMPDLGLSGAQYDQIAAYLEGLH
jgi:cytochrome c oxidase subunit 2